MKHKISNGEVELTGIGDFDLTKIFECGQCFRWKADENGAYTGVVKNRAARVRRVASSVFISGSAEDVEEIWWEYFDLDRNYEQIRHQLCIDDYMRRAVAYGKGIRILRQDKWEALCSFIISQNNNIARIKKIVDLLCREFGNRVDFKGEELYSFPSADRIARLNIEDLACIRCGYRAEYIVYAAREVAEGRMDLEKLAGCSPAEARAALKKLRGVGNKVADCAALFGLNIFETFPLDVWMKRAVAKQYGSGFDPKVFSPYEGIAQQYIYHYARSLGKKSISVSAHKAVV